MGTGGRPLYIEASGNVSLQIWHLTSSQKQKEAGTGLPVSGNPRGQVEEALAPVMKRSAWVLKALKNLEEGNERVTGSVWNV